jgi:hypothetical protein
MLNCGCSTRRNRARLASAISPHFAPRKRKPEKKEAARREGEHLKKAPRTKS